MLILTINGIVVEVPDLEKTAMLCAEMVERLGGRGRCNDNEVGQRDSPVLLELPTQVRIGEVVGAKL